MRVRRSDRRHVGELPAGRMHDPWSDRLRAIDALNLDLMKRLFAEACIRKARYVPVPGPDVGDNLAHVHTIAGTWVTWELEAEADGIHLAGQNPIALAGKAVGHFELH